MHFSLQDKPKDILKNRWVVISLLIALAIFLALTYVYEGIWGVYWMAFAIVCAVIAVSVKSLQKKSFQEFDTTEKGIVVKDKTYAWSQIKYYSWYGEKQGERIGVVGVVPFLNYDPINPYKFGKTQIVELKLGIGRHVKLQIDSAQVEKISSIFKQYGVKHISTLQKIVGL